MSGNELAIYQKLSPFILKARGHKLNNREIYQFTQLYTIKKNKYPVLKM
jgi:hypothetical protein